MEMPICSQTITLSHEMCMDPSQFTHIDNLLTRCVVKTIKITDLSIIHSYPSISSYNSINTILKFNIHDHSHLFDIQKYLVSIKSHNVIISGNLALYLLSPIPTNIGLFGAMLRNNSIEKLIINNVDKSLKKHLKTQLKQEQSKFIENIITPIHKIKIKFI